MTVTVYTPAQAAVAAQCPRVRVDAACASGALRAADLRPESTKRAWRIRAEDLDEWVLRGYPTEPTGTQPRPAGGYWDGI